MLPFQWKVSTAFTLSKVKVLSATNYYPER